MMLTKSRYRQSYFSCFTILLLSGTGITAQTKGGIENYSTLRKGGASVWMPVIHYRNKKALYAELRYNYEALNTGSLYAGRNFSGGKGLKYSITPMAGLVFGEYNGGSAAMNTELEYNKLAFSSQLQYTISKDKLQDDFFYNWSELYWQAFEWMYAGLSVQQTKLKNKRLSSEPGFLIGFEIKKLTIPLYIFSPLSSDRNLIIGLNIDW